MEQNVFIFVFPMIACLLAWLLMPFDFRTNSTLRKRALVERVNALLPQTQCGKCSYDGCLPYAEAIASGKADIITVRREAMKQSEIFLPCWAVI